MIVKLNAINRNVNLDNKLIKSYSQYGTLRESQFCTIITSTYDNDVSKESVSDEELSSLCNKSLRASLTTAKRLEVAIKKHKVENT